MRITRKGLASNDIVRLHVQGCTKVGSDYTEALAFRRIDIPADFIGTQRWDGKTHEPRRTVPLDPSSEYHVGFSLGNKLSAGSSGLVYEVLNPTLVHESASAGDVDISPLVIKIAARTKNKNLAREAWFYDEMQTLQGVVIPRCYGWFEAPLSEGTTFTPWENDDMERFFPEDDPTGERFFSYWDRGAFNEDSRTLLDRLHGDHTVSFILLERLGGPFLPAGVPLSKEMQDEVADAYAELSRLHIEHYDVRYDNILSVLPPPDGQPSIPSSHNGHVFKCRIIDFELSRKIMQKPEVILRCMMGFVKHMLEGLPDNDFFGQSFF